MKTFCFSFLILIFSVATNAAIPSQFTVGSYNVFGLRNQKEIKNDLAKLPQVQMWAFQEVEGPFTEKTEAKILEILPSGKWYIIAQKVNLLDSKKGIWEGQVIASRVPIESTEVLPLKHTSQKDRVALIAYFTAENGKKFFFANTDHEVKVMSLNFNDRKKQLLSLVEYFDTKDSVGVITGDFNTTGGQEEILKTEEVMALAQFERAKPFDKDSYTFEKMFIKTELDHFFSRGIESSLRYRLNDRSGSDHFPIYIDIDL